MAWKIINKIQVDKENEPPISFETCKKLFSNTNLRFKNQAIGLSLEDQAQALAYKCCLTEKCPAEFLTNGYCPKGIYGLDMPFGKDCLCYVVKDNDWLEYLENRQLPVDNSAK